MTSAARITASALLAGLLASQAWADLIPTPDFSDHAIPTTEVTSPPAAWWAAVDIALLFIALCLATYFALVSRSRQQLLLLTVTSLLYFGFVRGGCVCPIGATQNVAFAIANPSYVVPLTVVAFFVLPLVFTLFFGRTFCAAVCPLGTVQELVAVCATRVPRWLDQSLGVFPYIYLGTALILAATGSAFIICRFDPFVSMFRLSGSATMLTVGGCLLLIGVFVGRPYCRYLCPYGAILRVLSRQSKWQVRIPPTSCINCRLCEDACPYDAIQTPTTPLTSQQHESGKKRFLVTLAVTPLLVLLGATTGRWLGEPLANWNHEVQLATQVRQYELGLTSQPTTAVEAFQSAGRSPQSAYAAAMTLQDRYRVSGSWLGAWVGLVLAAKLLQFSLFRKRTDYRPNRSGCVACGRCFWYCPVEHVRLGNEEEDEEENAQCEQLGSAH